MNFIPKEIKGKPLKVYCATCKEEIKCGDMIAWSTDRKGTVKMHHMTCEKK